MLSRLEQREESLAAYAEADATFAPRNDAISRPGIRSPSVPPLILAIGTRLARWLAGGMIRPRLLEALDEARDAIRASWGVLPPGIIVADGYAGVSRDSYLVELHSVPLVSATLYENERLWPGPVEELAAAGLTGRATIQPDSGRPAAWLGREDWSLAERSGLPLWTDVEYIRRHLQAVLGKHLHELIGHQQVMTMAEQEAPASADALARNPSALTALVLVLRNLLEEGVPILDFREIVDAVVPMHRAGQDRLGILREIRLLPALRARLPGNAADGPLLALEDPLESEIAAAVRVIDGCSYLALDPARTQYVLGRVRAAMSLRSDLRGVVVTNGAIRRYVARLVDLEFPGLWVVSREELLPEREAAIVSVALANGASTS